METIFGSSLLKACYALEKWIALFENIKHFPEQLNTKSSTHNFTLQWLIKIDFSYMAGFWGRFRYRVFYLKIKLEFLK